MKKFLFLITILVVLLSSCKKEIDTPTLTVKNPTVTNILGYFNNLAYTGTNKSVLADLSPVCSYNFTNFVSSSAIPDSGSLALVNGIYHLDLGHNNDSTAIKVYYGSDGEEDIYESSTYAKPFNNLNGWSLAVWFRTDIITDAEMLEVRDTHQIIDTTLLGVNQGYKGDSISYHFDINFRDQNLILSYILEKSACYHAPDTIFTINSSNIDSQAKWHYYTFTCSQNVLKAYVDGQLVSSTDNVNMNTIFNQFYFLPEPNAHYYDNLSIWDKALSDQDILDEYTLQIKQ
jgi:Concanavalin A-like lectin/glucanases superfamily